MYALKQPRRGTPAQQIPGTILEQIGAQTLICIGVPRNSVYAIPATIDTDENGHLGGVQFRFSNCPIIRQGFVRITLSGDDTYRVVITNQLGNVKLDVSGIYCDQLAGQDGIIERTVG